MPTENGLNMNGLEFKELENTQSPSFSTIPELLRSVSCACMTQGNQMLRYVARDGIHSIVVSGE